MKKLFRILILPLVLFSAKPIFAQDGDSLPRIEMLEDGVFEGRPRKIDLTTGLDLQCSARTCTMVVNVVEDATTPSTGWNGDTTHSPSENDLYDLLVAGDPDMNGKPSVLENGSVSYAEMQLIATTNRVLGTNNGNGTAPEELTVSEILDFIGNTRGAILYRGSGGWAILTPGTSGYGLVSNGSGADPSYTALAPFLQGWDNGTSQTSGVYVIDAGTGISITKENVCIGGSNPGTLCPNQNECTGGTCVVDGYIALTQDTATGTFGKDQLPELCRYEWIAGDIKAGTTYYSTYSSTNTDSYHNGTPAFNGEAFRDIICLFPEDALTGETCQADLVSITWAASASDGSTPGAATVTQKLVCSTGTGTSAKSEWSCDSTSSAWTATTGDSWAVRTSNNNCASASAPLRCAIKVCETGL